MYKYFSINIFVLPTSNIIKKLTDRKYSTNKFFLIDLSKKELAYYSYKKINNASTIFAKKLIQQKLKPKDKIAIVLENSAEFIVMLLGAIKCGVVPVLINPKLSSVQIENIMRESNCKIVFDFKNSFVDFENLLEQEECEIYNPLPSDPIFVLYTSGSSGLPKGTIISHKNYNHMISQSSSTNSIKNNKYVSLISSPLFHANGLNSFFTSYNNYSTVVLFSKFEATSYIKAIEKFKVDCLFCVPSVLSMLLREEQLLKKTNLSSVNLIISASSDISQTLIDNVYKYFPHAELFNTYGSTETGMLLFGHHPAGVPRPVKSVGYPNKNFQFRIVDGILEVNGPLLIKEYTKDKDPRIKEDGFFVTNDLFEIDNNGFYYFLGQADDMFKCGGYRVYPRSVENILEEHPAVTSAVVLGIPDDVKGYKPYAFVTLCKNITEEELKEYTLKAGPAYQHPRRIWFVNSMPLTDTNKIDRKELMKRAIEELNLPH